MKRALGIILGFLLGAAAANADDASVARGEYLARAADCTACHSAEHHPPFAGGLPVASPFGTIYSTNITPDPENGIGRYSLEEFRLTLKEGIRKDGKHLYPAMPYTSYAYLSDDDISNLYAYFMHGVRASSYKPPETRLVFPFDQRWAIGLWNAGFAPRPGFVPDARRDVRWNRGAYLTQALGHCGACHTPRGWAFQEKASSADSPEFLKGGYIDHWFAANLRGDNASGLGRWSEADIAQFLKTGHGADAVAFGGMTQVVEDSTQYLTDADREALAHYLKSIAARRESARYLPEAEATHESDRAIATGSMETPGVGFYLASCAQCHGVSGKGALPRFPALAGNPAVMAEDPRSLIRIVLEGGRAARTEIAPARMPGFGARWTDQQIADVVSFIRTSWGNQASAVSARDVTQMRNTLAKP